MFYVECKNPDDRLSYICVRRSQNGHLTFPKWKKEPKWPSYMLNRFLTFFGLLSRFFCWTKGSEHSSQLFMNDKDWIVSNPRQWKCVYLQQSRRVNPNINKKSPHSRNYTIVITIVQKLKSGQGRPKKSFLRYEN